MIVYHQGLLQYSALISNRTEAMPVDGQLLEILCCPVSKVPLKFLSEKKLETLNAAITKGDALYIGGENVEKLLSEALVTEDGKVIYAVNDGIPVLLEEEGIGTTQFTNF
jgi:uncharacterized protein YbaR (Trm112 family)